MRSSTIAITVLCLMSVTVSPISESWRCRARLRIPPRERRRLSSAYAQSLGELAKKEKERRKKVTDESKVVTNDDLSRFKNAPVATGVLPPRTAEQKPAKGMTGVEAKSAAAGSGDRQSSGSFKRRSFNGISTRKSWRRQRHDSKSWKRKLAEAALFRDGSLRQLRNSRIAASRCEDGFSGLLGGRIVVGNEASTRIARKMWSRMV